MRLLSVFLVLFLLSSYGVPCADEAEEHARIVSEHAQAFTESHGHGVDLCSPFCSCHCCHSHTFRTGMLYLTDVTFFENIPTTYPSGHFDKVVHSIWEPPRTLS